MATSDKARMLSMASYDGTGEDVFCAMCGQHLTVETIAGMDEDGLAYCGYHTARSAPIAVFIVTGLVAWVGAVAIVAWWMW